MKRKFLIIVLISLVVTGVSAGFSSKNNVDLSSYIIDEDDTFCYHVPFKKDTDLGKLNDRYQPLLGKSYIAFKEALAFKESRGDYTIINDFGYLGKYQFSSATLQMIGVHTTDGFLDDSLLQEEAFEAYTARNKWILRKDIKRYVGKYINGVRITESGILAAAHLAGAGNVKKYLRSGGEHIFSDAFGTSMSYYLRKFSGYDTSLIIPERKASVF